MTTRTWSSPSETSIIETVCNVCICPCPDIHLPIVRHQKYERVPEDGMVDWWCVWLYQWYVTCCISPLWPRYPRLWHTMAGHTVTRHTSHRDIVTPDTGAQVSGWPVATHSPQTRLVQLQMWHQNMGASWSWSFRIVFSSYFAWFS